LRSLWQGWYQEYRKIQPDIKHPEYPYVTLFLRGCGFIFPNMQLKQERLYFILTQLFKDAG
jgi:hypothetical protein